MIEQFQSFIQNHHLFQKNNLLILAVSGGSDSVCLCELCHRSGFRLEIAHCNFQLRGEESNRDEQFVRALAEKYRVRLHTVRFNTDEYALNHKVSTQVAARELRYSWFDEIIREAKGDRGEVAFLLTAHHQDDSVETLLMNFFKGTGIHGLTGIPVRNKYIRRPLLFATKVQIHQFLTENNLSYVEDSSNLTDHYTRNFFRNKLLPAISEVYPNVHDNLAGNLVRLGDVAVLYDQAVRDITHHLAEKKGEEIHISVLNLKKTPAFRTILFEMISNYGFTASQLPEITKLLESDSGRYVKSASHRILKNRNWLIIAPFESKQSAHFLIEHGEQEINFAGGRLTIKRRNWNKEMSIPKEADTAIIDAAKIQYPLLLRPWQQGDYFYPLGMNKKKKLSRFFIDRKMSLIEKEGVWVVEMNKKILWIVGMRIDNRFRVTGQTKEVLVLKILE